MDRLTEILRLLQHVRRLAECLRDDGVEDDVGAGNGIGGAHHTELELVSGESKGRGAVPVRGVLVEIRQRGDTGIQLRAVDRMGRRARGAELVDDILQLVPDEDRNDGRRRLAGAETVVVSDIGRGHPEQSRMIVHCLHDAGEDKKELHVFVGRISRIQEVDAVICRE